ncbi:hypothetical protein IWQ60_004315 [Tieghemiomyces parasiticus]|uniref:Uncharacterized protein n=1 Tax=Tieghemiomyces parasiticus TaxID=78921 RepID=A0A9W8DZW7_9FUNG|nr:hypothetical protein IWQ60_004315 [Tieghemiomyces parasiticus]
MQSAKSRCTVPKIPGSNGSRDGCPGLDLMTLVSYARTYPTQVAYEVSYLDRQIDHQFKTRHIPKWPSMAKSRSPQLLMLALPHHIDRFHAPTFLTGTSGYVAPKGAMAAVLGDVWYERIGPADTDTLKNLMKTNQFPTNPIHEAFTSLTGYNPLDEINRDLRRLVIELTEPKAGQSSWGKLDSFMVILNKWFSPETKPESVPNFVTEDDVWDVGYERRRGLSHGLIVWASMQVAQYVSARKRKDTEKLDGAAWLTEHSEALQQLVDDYITIEPSRSEGLIYHGMDFYEGHASSPGTLVDSFGISLTTVSEALMAYWGRDQAHIDAAAQF